MKKTLTSIVLLFTLSAQLAAQDALNLADAAIVNAPNVRTWPATATITELSFLEGTTRVVFSKEYGNGAWPDVTPAGWDGPLQYTLWLCLKTPTWTCSAFIQFWNGRDGTGNSADPDVPSRWDQHWYYSSRWAPLFGHGQIQPGELIGLFVTSGNARDSAGPYGPQERSNVVVVPATDRGTFTFAPPPPVATPPPPVIVVPPPPVVTPPPVVVPAPVLDLSGVQRQLAALTQEVRDGRAENRTFFDGVKSIWAQIGEPLLKYVLPAVAAFVAGKKL